MKSELTVVGHLVIDFIERDEDKNVKISLGGPPAYTSIVASKLGMKVKVVSNVGEDFPEEYIKILRRQRVDLSHLKVIKGAKTTSFLIRYIGEERRMKLLNLAPPLKLECLPKNLESGVFHVAPVANEVPNGIFKLLKRKGALTSFDPQGRLRAFDSEGRVSLARSTDMRFLEYVDILKASRRELLALTSTESVSEAIRKLRDFGLKIIIATFGEGGSRIIYENTEYYVPAFKVRRVVNPTGAGDVFIGGFLAEYTKGKDPLWSACVASTSASYIVEGVGLREFVDKNAIYSRAELLLKNVKCNS